MTRWISVDVITVELRRAERKDARAGGGHILDHDVEVNLLGDGGVRPGRRAVAGCELERQAGRGVAGGDNHPVIALVGNGLSQQPRVKPGQRRGVGTVEDHMVQASDHDHDDAITPAGQAIPGRPA